MAPCRGTRKKPSANSGASSAGGRASGTGPGTSSRSATARGPGKERLGGPIGRHLVELRHVVHDPVHLRHQPVEILLPHRELGELGDMQHFIAPDAHALSHSRSRPA